MTMAQSKAFYVAATPLVFLLILGTAARVMPALCGNDPSSENLRTAIDATPSVSTSDDAVVATAPPMRGVDTRTQTALEKAVAGQIASFHKNDFKKALSFAAPSFRSVFSADQFRAMILSQYMPLTESVKQSFRPAKGNGAIAVMPVTVIDSKKGGRFVYLYSFARDKEAWVITGCSGGDADLPPVNTAPADVREI